ncbi:MAG: glycosyltransferase, partial [Acetobacteraceae bacterium]|nr:glycosyltransferase [Acetobacteraceae bacterium]
LTVSLGLAGRVHFAGHVRDPDELIQGFDIFALSSDTEQMPISLLEAMAAGLPTAATDVGDIASMLPVENRPFITPCDDRALGAALLKLARDSGLRAELGRASRQRAELHFDEAQMFDRWSAILAGAPHSGEQVT